MFLFSQLYSSVSVTSLACYPRSADWWLLFSLSLSRDKVVTSLIGGLFLLLHIYLSPFPNSFLSRTHTHFLSPPSSSPFFIFHPSTLNPPLFQNSSTLLHPCGTLKHEKVVGVKVTTLISLKFSI